VVIVIATITLVCFDSSLPLVVYRLLSITKSTFMHVKIGITRCQRGEDPREKDPPPAATSYSGTSSSRPATG
jgi:hypothetical protein